MTETLELTQATLQEILEYDSETGEVTWRERPKHYFKSFKDHAKWNGQRAGKPAGSLRHDGRYMRITLFDRHYLLHRVIVLYMTGEMPKRVRFKDGDFSNLKWDNLIYN